MKTALIVIGRQENRYCREFIEHHLKVGIDHIFVLDNNRQGEDHFEDVLQDYIEAGKVTIKGCEWFSQYERVGGGAVSFVQKFLIRIQNLQPRLSVCLAVLLKSLKKLPKFIPPKRLKTI